eukprot:1067513-Pleurochrysis_carterae.AAC.1
MGWGGGGGKVKGEGRERRRGREQRADCAREVERGREGLERAQSLTRRPVRRRTRARARAYGRLHRTSWRTHNLAHAQLGARTSWRTHCTEQVGAWRRRAHTRMIRQ